jgi:hypothetical protein
MTSYFGCRLPRFVIHWRMWVAAEVEYLLDPGFWELGTSN